MRLPSKVTSFEMSSLAIFAPILNLLKHNQEMQPDVLIEELHITSIEIFIEALIFLFALGSIDLTEDGEKVRYVERDLFQ